MLEKSIKQMFGCVKKRERKREVVTWALLLFTIFLKVAWRTRQASFLSESFVQRVYMFNNPIYTIDFVSQDF